jgi:hypothetical protein
MSSAKSLPGRFLPVFWSPVWFPTQKPNTMGILCDPRHPAFAEFPTEAYSNWQWWDIVNNSRSIILDDALGAFRPVIQIIDNFARNHRLSLLLEARVGSGSLLLSTMPLPDLAAKCPPARQLLQSLYDYAGSDAFHPAQSLDVSYLDPFLQHGPRGVMQKLGAKIVRVDSEVEGYEAVNMFDEDPTSIWHTSWGDGAKPLPHEVVISFQKPVKLAGLRILPRQDIDNGKIKDYVVAVSDDDQTWQQAAKGEFDGSAAEKEVLFGKPQTARYLKLTALSAYGNAPFVSVAELLVVEAK